MLYICINIRLDNIFFFMRGGWYQEDMGLSRGAGAGGEGLSSNSE